MNTGLVMHLMKYHESSVVVSLCNTDVLFLHQSGLRLTCVGKVYNCRLFIWTCDYYLNCKFHLSFSTTIYTCHILTIMVIHIIITLLSYIAAAASLKKWVILIHYIYVHSPIYLAVSSHHSFSTIFLKDLDLASNSTRHFLLSHISFCCFFIHQFLEQAIGT